MFSSLRGVIGRGALIAALYGDLVGMVFSVMASTLLSGPAGSGKSQAALDLIEAALGPIVHIGFQELYATLLGLSRGADGRYPERLPEHDFLIPIVEYIRTVLARRAAEADVDVVMTNSDGSPERRARLLALLGAGATEQVIDPGRAVVVERLTRNGSLSQQCSQAIDRWYTRL